MVAVNTQVDEIDDPRTLGGVFKGSYIVEGSVRWAISPRRAVIIGVESVAIV